MSQTEARRIHSAVAALVMGTTALGSQLPGLSFFTNFAPPLFGPLKLMSGGLTLAIFVWVLLSPPKRAARAGLGVAAVIVAVSLAIIYSALLDWTTVSAPPESGIEQRFQIGFGLTPFSLTQEGIKLVQSSPDTATPENLMLTVGAFRPGGPGLIWKSWTITAAWLLLSCVFLFAYLAWSFGLACVALRLTNRSKS
jgi:hypothetical protein